MSRPQLWEWVRGSQGYQQMVSLDDQPIIETQNNESRSKSGGMDSAAEIWIGPGAIGIYEN